MAEVLDIVVKPTNDGYELTLEGFWGVQELFAGASSGQEVTKIHIVRIK